MLMTFCRSLNRPAIIRIQRKFALTSRNGASNNWKAPHYPRKLVPSCASVFCVMVRRLLSNDDEALLLSKAWSVFETKEADEIFVTFNGTRFDWPFLARRSYALGVVVPLWYPADGRWPLRTHCDLYTLWQAGDRTESISLDRLARLCGLGGKIGNGAEFGKLWTEDRNAALDYLRQDLKLTRDLWRRMARCYDAERRS